MDHIKQQQGSPPPSFTIPDHSWCRVSNTSQQPQEFQQIVLSQNFFYNLTIIEQRYEESHRSDQNIFVQLIQSYTDCVSYFELREEPVSEYFQTRLKNLIKSVKLNKKSHQKAKNTINNSVLIQMQKSDVDNLIKKQSEKMLTVKRSIDDILRQQDQRIQQRRRRTRKQGKLSCMTKSHSVTFSLQSLSSSPDIKRNKGERRVKNLQFLFRQDINSQEQSGDQKVVSPLKNTTY